MKAGERICMCLNSVDLKLSSVMAKKTHFPVRRIFSESLKKQLVRSIENGTSSVLSVSRDQQVSKAAVYKWLNRYSHYLQSGQTVVVQMKSEESAKKLLEKRIAELEAALGRKQMEVDFLNQLLDTGKKEFKIDLKKKLSTPPFNGSGSTKHNTATG